MSSDFILDVVCQPLLSNRLTLQSLHQCQPGVGICCRVLILPPSENIAVTVVDIPWADEGNSLEYTMVYPQLQSHIPPLAWYLSGYLIHEV